MNHTSLLAAATICIMVCGCAQQPLDTARGHAPEREYVEHLQPWIEDTVRDEKITGLALGIVQDGRLVYAHGFGVMKVGGPATPVTTATLFHMASVTKPFVAMAVMQLVEQGRVGLDEPVAKYLPYFRTKDPRSGSITIGQMLSHTSGLPDVDGYNWEKPEYDDGALERYVRSLGDKTLLWEPGARWAYSNMAYEVLGDLVAKVAGMSFEGYVEARILKPLGMKSSTLLLVKADPARLASGYTHAEDGTVRAVPHYPYNRAHTPSSNLHSSVDDMARWALANLNRGELDGKRVLAASTYDVMWKPVAETGIPGLRMGMGWALVDGPKGEQLVYHDGDDDGFQTFVVLSPSRGIGVVAMANCDYAPLKRIVEASLKTAFGSEFTFPK